MAEGKVLLAAVALDRVVAEAEAELAPLEVALLVLLLLTADQLWLEQS